MKNAAIAYARAFHLAARATGPNASSHKGDSNYLGISTRGNFAAVKPVAGIKRVQDGRRQMSHYIAIFVEDHIGEWRVVFPDAPGCEARGFTLHDAQFVAASALSRWLRENGPLPALPMSMAAVAKRTDWQEKNCVDLSKAVVSMISLAA